MNFEEIVSGFTPRQKRQFILLVLYHLTGNERYREEAEKLGEMSDEEYEEMISSAEEERALREYMESISTSRLTPAVKCLSRIMPCPMQLK